MTHLVATLPLKIESTANKREHWRVRAARAADHRLWGRSAFGLHQPLGWKAKAVPPEPPLTVTLTRIAPRELDSDNLAISFKSVRDGIADWLGINDNDKRVTWVYEQERGAPKHYACRVEIKTLTESSEAARTQAGAADRQEPEMSE